MSVSSCSTPSVVLALLFLSPAGGDAEDSKDLASIQKPFAVKVTGRGAPMILIPGLACSGAVYDETVERFKGRHQCHVLTLAGFAGQPPVGGPFLDTMRVGIVRYIRDHKLQKPVLVGHSLGAFLAFWIAATEPDLIGSVIAIDGVPCLTALFAPNLSPDERKARGAAAAKQILEAPAESYRDRQRQSLAGWIRDPKPLAQAVQWGLDSDRKTVAQAMGELFAMDIRDDLAKIKVPVLMLVAYSKVMDDAGMTRTAAEQRYAAQIAKAPKRQLAIANDARHFIMFDEPHWMFETMDRFLARK